MVAASALGRTAAAWPGWRCAQSSDVRRSSLLFPVITLLLGLVALVPMYHKSRQNIDDWGQFRTASTSVAVATIINSCWIVSLLSPPPSHRCRRVGQFWHPIVGGLSMFKPPCGFGCFVVQLDFKSLLPLVAILTLAATRLELW